MREALRLFVLCSFCTACHGRAAVPERPIQARESTAAERTAVSLTVYNGDFGVVREVRRMNLGLGKIALAVRDVAEQIEPETVRVRSLTAAEGLTVLEQNFRYDLLTPDKLLEKYVGRRVTIHRDDEALGGEQTVQAEVLAFNGKDPVFRIQGVTTSGLNGRISFADVPPTLVDRPTLIVLLGSNGPMQEVEVAYVTKKVGWRADYSLRVDEPAAHGELYGWVTLTNASGASYEDAEVKLVAGDVHHSAPPPMMDYSARDLAGPPPPIQWSEQPIFEYHEYALARPTSLLDHEEKQVLLLEAYGIATARRFVFDSGVEADRNLVGAPATDRKAAVYLEVENTESNHLGFPLPAGIVHLYRADAAGEPHVIGVADIDDTARGEKFRVRAGSTSDLRADRTQLSYNRVDSGCATESEWEVALRNHKDSEQTVEVVERKAGEWEILSSSQPVARRAARAFMFRVTVPARGEAKIRYRVLVRWCRR